QLLRGDARYAQRAKESASLRVLPPNISRKADDKKYGQQPAEAGRVREDIFQLIAEQVAEQFERPDPEQDRTAKHASKRLLSRTNNRCDYSSLHPRAGLFECPLRRVSLTLNSRFDICLTLEYLDAKGYEKKRTRS